jgi:hypothetical protein
MGESMSTLSAKDVESAIEARFDYDEENEDECLESWSELAWSLDHDSKETLVVNGETYPLSVVEEDTGGEGHGEYVYIIVKVGDQTFKKEGAYFSHYGTDWDGPFFEVNKVEKTVEVYERVKA